MPTFFDALIFPKDDKVPTNESNIFRGEEVDVLFMTNLSNCEPNFPLGNLLDKNTTSNKQYIQLLFYFIVFNLFIW